MGKNKGLTIMSSGLIFCLGLYILLYGGTQIAEEWKESLQEEIVQMTEKSFLPGLFYVEREEKTDLHAWITKKAMQMIPLGSYVEGKGTYEAEIEDTATYEMILARQAADENEVDENGNLINGDGSHAEKDAQEVKTEPIHVSVEQLRDFNYLVSHYYTVDSTTMIGPEQLNVDELLAKDMHLDTSREGPKVLIFHTHSQETFVDSTEGDVSTSIVGIGAYLTELLNAKGIPTMHHDGVYDLINGKLDRSKAYEFSEVGVRKILEENPSIEVVIDLHRDGVGNDTHLVTEANGKQAAKIMFFNGLSRTKANGDIAYLPNPYIQDNLSFSLQMQLASESMYPGFTRKIYLKGYRYSLHMMPKSLLIEAGAQTNTVEEMKNAMELLADVLTKVIVG